MGESKNLEEDSELRTRRRKNNSKKGKIWAKEAAGKGTKARKPEGSKGGNRGGGRI